MPGKEGDFCDRCGKKTKGTPGARGGHPGNACCCEDCLKVLAFDEAAENLGMTMMQFYDYIYALFIDKIIGV